MRFAAAVVVVAASLAGPASGQIPPPLAGGGSRPAYSPYLNLTRPGGGPAQNYYGLVRPELEVRANINGLRRETQVLATTVSTPAQELETGHATGYMTHLHYFGTNGLGRVGVGHTSAPLATAPASRRR